jgi:hypothetical protein
MPNITSATETKENVVNCNNFLWCKIKQPDWLLTDGLCVDCSLNDIIKMTFKISLCSECKKINDIIQEYNICVDCFEL